MSVKFVIIILGVNMRQQYIQNKKETFINFLKREQITDKLIISSLLIGMTHDLCKKENKLFVSEGFINDCLLNLIIDNREDFNNLELFDLIRNKLAHGDYYVEDNNVVLKYKGKTYNVSINSICQYAIKLSTYYKYLNSDIPCTDLIIYDGFAIRRTDICKMTIYINIIMN